MAVFQAVIALAQLKAQLLYGNRTFCHFGSAKASPSKTSISISATCSHSPLTPSRFPTATSPKNPNAASVTLKEIARKPLVLTVFAARRHKTSPKALSQNASQNSITQEPLILSGIVGHMVYLTWIFSVIIPQPQSRS